MEVQIPQEVHDKIMHWVNKADEEVSGFGKVIYHTETKVFEVLSAHLLDQEVGAAHTDIKPESLNRLMFQTKDLPGELKWWWHSHVKMPVFWSMTDKETIKDLGINGWILASVFNQRQEIRSACGYVTGSVFGKGVEIADELKTFIMSPPDARTAQWDAEFDLHVKKRPVVPISHPSVYDDKYWDEYERDWKVKQNQKVSPEIKDTSIIKNAGDYDLYDWGMYGYGCEAEAKTLGMTPMGYYQVLQIGTPEQMTEIEDKLDAAARRGELSYGTSV